MTRKCDLTGKLVITGNNVSHANNKTKRIATSTLRTVEKNGGIDSFLLNSFSKNLSINAKKYKKSISKATLEESTKKD